jgi:hypothetical protein
LNPQPLNLPPRGSPLSTISIRGYAYLVPFIEDEEGKFLKTIIPSRKTTREYLGEWKSVKNLKKDIEDTLVRL